MKKTKGEIGYVDNQKRRNLFLSVLGISLFVIIYLIGYYIYNTKNNLLTLLAVLLILPASQFITKFILFSKYKSGSIKTYERLKAISHNLLILCDLLIVRDKQTKYFQFIIINDNNIMLLNNEKGKKSSSNNDSKYLIEKILKSKGYEANIIIFDNDEELINYLSNQSINNRNNDKQDELIKILLLNSI